MQFRKNALPESTIYEILSNGRRRGTIQHLTERLPAETVGLHELSEAVAIEESGQSPPPRALRESVYGSLHQTHLPKLEELGVVTYDREMGTVSLCTRARDVTLYMSVLTRYGVTWDEFYRLLGTATLALTIGALVELPGVSAIDPLLWASGGLVVFALAITSQLWADRWTLLRILRR